MRTKRAFAFAGIDDHDICNCSPAPILHESFAGMQPGRAYGSCAGKWPGQGGSFSRPLYKVAGLSAALDAVSMPRCITRTPTVAVKAWPNPAENSHAFRRTLWHAAIRIGRLEADSN